jgi:hypothetical protein
MARVRYIGPEPVTVPELGSREIQPDEVVEVDDSRFEGYVSQVTNWQSVEEPGAREAAAKKSGGARASQKEG